MIASVDARSRLTALAKLLRAQRAACATTVREMEEIVPQCGFSPEGVEMFMKKVRAFDTAEAN